MFDDNKPSLHVIGVGPGDPEMLTLKGRRIIKAAQVIFAPCSALKKDSLALEIVMGVFDSDEITAEIVNQVYPMSRDKNVLKEYWDRAADEIKAKLSGGKEGVFITLGDPSLYSTWSYLRPRVESLNITCEIVPGISSFFMGAARVGRELAIGEDRLAIIPMPDNRVELESLMKHFDTLVLMKIGRDMVRLKEMLIQSGYMGRAWIISRCGLPGEQVMPMNESISESLGYLSHVIIYKENRTGEQKE